jgi:hypothetical protein
MNTSEPIEVCGEIEGSIGHPVAAWDVWIGILILATVAFWAYVIFARK